MYTGSQLAGFACGLIGQPYWYGCVCYPCTEGLLKAKKKQYPDHYAEKRMPRYREDVAAGKTAMDCVGLIKGFFWTKNGTESSKYARDCPDKSANGMFEYAKSKKMDWGSIGTIPDEPGICVRFDGHVGLYVGNGNVVEARGFNYGVVQTRLKDRKWTHWYRMPGIKYTIPEEAASSLERGSAGDQVLALQRLLIRAGYSLPLYGADGEFGGETEAAVMAAQKKNGLATTGKCDPVLLHLLETAPPNEDGGSPDVSTPPGKILTVTGDKVNLRTGPGTEYQSVGRRNKGDALPGVDGWTPVWVDGSVRWISSEYVRER